MQDVSPCMHAQSTLTLTSTSAMRRQATRMFCNASLLVMTPGSLHTAKAEKQSFQPYTQSQAEAESLTSSCIEYLWHGQPVNVVLHPGRLRKQHGCPNMPTWRSMVDLPPMFGPVSSMKGGWSPPRDTSLAMKLPDDKAAAPPAAGCLSS